MRGPQLQGICRTTFAPLTVTVDMTHFMFYRKVIDVALLAARLHKVSPPPLAAGYRGSLANSTPADIAVAWRGVRTLGGAARTTSAAAKRPCFHCGVAGHTLDS